MTEGGSPAPQRVDPPLPSESPPAKRAEMGSDLFRGFLGVVGQPRSDDRSAVRADTVPLCGDGDQSDFVVSNGSLDGRPFRDKRANLSHCVIWLAAPVSDPYDACAGDNRLVDRAPLSRLAMKVGGDECVVLSDSLRDFHIACSSADDIDRTLRGVAEEGEDDGRVVPHIFVEQ